MGNWKTFKDRDSNIYSRSVSPDTGVLSALSVHLVDPALSVTQIPVPPRTVRKWPPKYFSLPSIIAQPEPAERPRDSSSNV